MNSSNTITRLRSCTMYCKATQEHMTSVRNVLKAFLLQDLIIKHIYNCNQIKRDNLQHGFPKCI